MHNGRPRLARQLARARSWEASILDTTTIPPRGTDAHTGARAQYPSRKREAATPRQPATPGIALSNGDKTQPALTARWPYPNNGHKKSLLFRPDSTGCSRRLSATHVPNVGPSPSPLRWPPPKQTVALSPALAGNRKTVGPQDTAAQLQMPTARPRGVAA